MQDFASLIDTEALQETQRRAAKVLAPFLTADRPTAARLAQPLRPHDGDYDLVFQAEIADAMRQHFEHLWDQGIAPIPNKGQTRMLVRTCPAVLLGSANPLSDRFPGGYRRLAPMLQPDVVWVAFKFVRPGSTSGMAFDGLVNVEGDRWAWFPKPWRGLS